MNSTEIIMLVIGALVAAAGFLLPEKKTAKADTRKEEERIREFTERQLKEAESRIEIAAEESIQNAVEKTERGLDRLTNEKMQAVNDYSDTVLKEINRNHEEVMFLYDMLNDKQVQIKNTAAEVAKTAKQAQEDAKDAELAAKQAAENAQTAESAAGEAAEKAQSAEAMAEEAAESARSAQTLAGEAAESARSAEALAGEAAENARSAEVLTGQMVEKVQSAGNLAEQAAEKVQNSVIAVSQAEGEPQDLKQGLEQPPEGVLQTENEVKTEVKEKGSGVAAGKAKAVRKKTDKTVKPAETPKKQTAARKAKPAKEKEEATGSESPKDDIQIQFATGDGENQNNNTRILNLHKMGKSNMAIAKELGLGIGEVKLVIDLFEGM